MKFKATPISYRATGLFSGLVNDYLEAKGTAQSFVEYNATLDGYKKAIEQRASFPTNRKVSFLPSSKFFNYFKLNSKRFKSFNNSSVFLIFKKLYNTLSNSFSYFIN